MEDTLKIKHISDIPLEDSEIQVKEPFKVSKEDRRRFVRLEISTPLTLKNLNDFLNNNTAFDNLFELSGEIINISATGVLIEIENPIIENDVVLMKFTIQDVETMSNVLGLVKRTDLTDGIHLAGIEFISTDQLCDRFSTAECDLIAGQAASFKEQIHKTLSKYLYHEKK